MRAVVVVAAPRGAALYRSRSGQGREEMSRDLMADPWSERVDGENSMPGNRRSCPGVRSGAPGDPRDMAKAGLPESQSPEGAKAHLPERRPKPVPAPVAGSLQTCRNPLGRWSDALSGY